MTPEPTSRVALLRAGTRDAHAMIETVPALSRLLAPDLRRAEYVSVLQNLHAFHSCAEPAAAAELDSIPAAAAMLDGARPRALGDDLAWFKAAAIAPPILPVLDGPAAALGALYVIEGSGLGGRVIARHLSDSLDIAMGNGGNFFFRLDAESARERWRRLVEILETAVLDDGTPDGRTAADQLLVAGARETFHAMEAWMRMIKTVPNSSRAEALAAAS